MRVDCYNACACSVANLNYGDTCYYSDDLYIRVNPIGRLSRCVDDDECVLVKLCTGDMTIVHLSTNVVLADTKVVANTKDIQ